MGEDLRFRSAKPGEEADLSELAMRSKAYWGYSSTELAAWQSDLRVESDDIAAGTIAVCEQDGAILGFYLLRPSSQSAALEHLWVEPQRARRGIGRALLAHALERARLLGASQVEIDADPNAEAFYLACGARRVGVEAAPLAHAPNRVRPQLVLASSQAVSSARNSQSSLASG